MRDLPCSHHEPYALPGTRGQVLPQQLIRRPGLLPAAKPDPERACVARRHPGGETMERRGYLFTCVTTWEAQGKDCR